MASRPPRRFVQISLRTLLIVMTLICVGIVAKQQYDWHWKRQRIHQWIAPIVSSAEAAQGQVENYNDVAFPTPNLTNPEQIAVLRFGVLHLDQPVERLAALKVLVERHGPASLPTLRELVAETKDHELQALLLHLISVQRNPDDLARFEAFLTSPSPQIRAAAAEAIGHVKMPSYAASSPIRTNTLPPVDVSSLTVDWPWSVQQAMRIPGEAARQSKIPLATRNRLEQVMLHGATVEERTAAARALVAWPPPDYSLRIAEWGVWIDNSSGSLIVAKVLEENPPFVHAVGNARKSLTPNRDYPWSYFTTKPVVHLTADRPMAVDVEVVLEEGRPWFVFPRPDAIVVHGPAPVSQHLDMTESPKIVHRDFPELEPQRLPEMELGIEGYVWLHPASRRDDYRMFFSSARAPHPDSMGLRWQSLIVAPQRQAWANLAEVPADNKFDWWRALRDVPGSWVTSQGETERFLYYDGPTMARTPLLATWEAETLQLESQRVFKPSREHRDSYPTPFENPASTREYMLIEVGATPRALSKTTTTKLGARSEFDLSKESWLAGEEVEAAFSEILRGRDLTAEEAGGLIASWRERFFATPGRRLLVFLTPAEYDAMCPLDVRPPPTETVRVGIILREFGE